MAVLFNRPHANLAAPGLDTPSVQVNQVINTMEIRLTKNAWPVNAQITASLEYSTDNEVTWMPGGAVTDDGTRAKDTFIRSQFSPPLATGTFWRGHVTVNQTLDTGVIITVT